MDEGVVLKQQTTLEERRQQARETVRRLDLSLPLLLDEMDNRANVAFAAWPERLVLVGGRRTDRLPRQSRPVGLLAG